MLLLLFEVIQFIHFYPLGEALGQGLRHVLDKITWWCFQFLFWVPINISKDWKAKLESNYSFMLEYSKM